MPELPEVETTVRALRQPLLGKTLLDVRSEWPRQIVTPDIEEMRYRIQGRRILSIERRAKYIVISLSEGETLIVHLKMSGHLSVQNGDEEPHRHVRTIFLLDNRQELRFRDQRKFGRIYLVKDPESVLGDLGPEPLQTSFTADRLAERLKGRKGVLKPLLLDQRFVAGIGNIYANEALYYASILPDRRADTLSRAEVRALHDAIQRVLRLGIDSGGASIDLYRKPDGTLGDMQNAFAVHNRDGSPCVDCGTLIQRVVLGSRGTYFCPHCQK